MSGTERGFRAGVAGGVRNVKSLEGSWDGPSVSLVCCPASLRSPWLTVPGCTLQLRDGQASECWVKKVKLKGVSGEPAAGVVGAGF